MKYEIKIKRKLKNSFDSFYQSFYFEGTGNETISAVLDYLNSDDLFDINGKPAYKIMWSCSCHQGVCGACSMVINKKPLLACKTKLKDLNAKIITLEPLSKFPVIADLETDRSSLYTIPIFHEIYNLSNSKYDLHQSEIDYMASKCMKCGICLEVCPEAKIDKNNLGANFLVDCYISYSKNSNNEEKKRIKKEYDKYFGNACSKTFACVTHCPASIDLKKLINYMNKKW